MKMSYHILNSVQQRVNFWKNLENHENEWLHLNKMFYKIDRYYFDTLLIPEETKKLFMRSNKVFHLKNLPNLTHLNCSNCYFETNSEFAFPETLQFLSLEQIDIEPNTFIKLLKALPQNLEVLNVNETPFRSEYIEFLPKNLKVLKVNSTCIEEFPFVNPETKVSFEDTPYEKSLSR
jgi:hypothetical protein